MCKSIKPTHKQQALRKAFGKFPTGVAVVTSVSKEHKAIGMTISSFNTVSMNPPLVSWCVERKARSYRDFSLCDSFNINVLADDQETLARRFATQGADKFSGVPVEPGRPPKIPGTSARFLCRTERKVLFGDHLMLIGRVVEFDNNSASPLIFANGDFHQLAVSEVEDQSNLIKKVA